MKILLTNDDGYAAVGIQALYDVLSLEHDVTLAAPDRERSAVGHGITLNEPLRIHPIQTRDSQKQFAINGTPADCVKLGLFKLYESPPDVVISGINPGCNTGINLNYSGTVGAAREASLNNILSMAVSIAHGPGMDFNGMAVFINQLLPKVVENGLPQRTFLNINAPDIPFHEIKGVHVTRQSSSNLSSAFDNRTDPKNNPYYWYSQVNNHGTEPDTDIEALSRQYISITPVQCDSTDYRCLTELTHLVSR